MFVLASTPEKVLYILVRPDLMQPACIYKEKYSRCPALYMPRAFRYLDGWGTTRLAAIDSFGRSLVAAEIGSQRSINVSLSVCECVCLFKSYALLIIGRDVGTTDAQPRTDPTALAVGAVIDEKAPPPTQKRKRTCRGSIDPGLWGL